MPMSNAGFMNLIETVRPTTGDDQGKQSHDLCDIGLAQYHCVSRNYWDSAQGISSAILRI